MISPRHAAGWLRARPVRARIAVRRRVFRLARRVTPLLAVESGGFTFLVRTADTSIGPSLFAKRRRKEMTVLGRAVAALEAAGALEQRRTFVDVGANIGTTTLSALGHGFARVVAIEPEPENAALLRANVALNRAEERVVVREVALSSSAGSAQLDVTKRSSGKPRIRSDGRTTGRTFLEVPTTTLTALVETGDVDPDWTDLLWLDIEGHEAQALAGAAPLLERGVPVVLEFNLKFLPEEDRRRLAEELLPEHYTHVMDLGAVSREFRPIRPSAFDLRARGRLATDFLLCRLP